MWKTLLSAAAVIEHGADAVVSYPEGGAAARTPTRMGCRHLGRTRYPSPVGEVVGVVGGMGVVGGWWWWWVLRVGWGTQQGVWGVGVGWVGDAAVQRPNIDVL